MTEAVVLDLLREAFWLTLVLVAWLRCFRRRHKSMNKP